MRADRLISILMLLQTRGKMTARELAEELEVSERTVYRDVEALCLSGVPLYAEHGPGGGLMLLESYRTTLTGLNLDEMRALFMLLGSSPLDRLGAGQELKSAVLKLSAAMPEARRAEEEKVRQHFYLDWSWWFHEQEPVPHLAVLQQAVWAERQVRLQYRTWFGTVLTVAVEPYGLVAKAGAWYLVAGVAGKPQVYRVPWLTHVEPLDQGFTRPTGFDLASFWQQWCVEYEQQQRAFLVTLRISPDAAQVLPIYFGQWAVDELRNQGGLDAQGWATVTLPFESFEAARERILGLGNAVEVLEPFALRCSVIDYAEQITRFYQARAADQQN